MLCKVELLNGGGITTQKAKKTTFTRPAGAGCTVLDPLVTQQGGERSCSARLRSLHARASEHKNEFLGCLRLCAYGAITKGLH